MPRKRKLAPKLVQGKDPKQLAQIMAIKSRSFGKNKLEYIPATYESQGLIGLRKYADNWYGRYQKNQNVANVWRYKKDFMVWYSKNPRPGNCHLVLCDPSKKASPDNVKYVSEEFSEMRRGVRRIGSIYFFIQYDPGFVGLPGQWRGRVRISGQYAEKPYYVYREFDSEKLAARWADWVLEKKYGIYAVFNRDIDPSLGRQDFDDIPLELYGGYDS